MGRLEHTDVDYDAKFPILLNDDHLSHLLILRSHVEAKHGGVEITLSRLRSRYWVVRGRQVVKRVLYRCVICR